MKKLIFIVLIVSLFSFIGLSQYHHVDVLPSQSGQELLDNLVQNYKPSSVLSYNDARDVMYSDIDNVNDYVSGIYTDHTLYLDPSAAPRAFLYMNGDNDGINCEHTYPRSKGADSGNPQSDMHHLYPSRTYVNGSRGSKPFADIPDNETDNWFIQNQSQSNIPSSGIDNYSEDEVSAFEPRESVKGNIARSIMYFYTMYKSEADAADPEFFDAQKETLCQWHYEDPVDATENSRTYEIAGHQGNRPNPFVLDCSLAGRSYCDMISDQCSQTVSSNNLDSITEIKIYPNPSSNQLSIDIGKRISKMGLKIYNTSGEEVYNADYDDTRLISIQSNLQPAFYIISLSLDDITINKSVIIE